MKCRHCASELDYCFVDLGTAPPSNAYLLKSQLDEPERYYPLRVFVCQKCWLVQSVEFSRAEDLFDKDYAYFSSVSKSWLAHCANFVGDAVSRFGLDASSQVVEVAANDGYLLQYVRDRGIPCYGIEPTAKAAAIARQKGLEIHEEFFGEDVGGRLAGEKGLADLIIANNVVAHIPDINDFLVGFKNLLKPDGIATFEFQYLVNLVRFTQFDTIYHEHFYYLSLSALDGILTRNGLDLFDVEELPTHGGSLRCYVQRKDTRTNRREERVSDLLRREFELGVTSIDYYRDFQEKANAVKNTFLKYLIDCKNLGLTVAGYGAAAKGNTLMNFAGTRKDLLAFVVDNNPEKQNKYLPGSRIPIVSEQYLVDQKPDRVVILPWNIASEISESLSCLKSWGGRMVRFIPEFEEIDPR